MFREVGTQVSPIIISRPSPRTAALIIISFLLLLMSVLQQNWRKGQTEQVLPGSKGAGDRGEKWPKQYMHI
jgi:hypothetical protein